MPLRHALLPALLSLLLTVLSGCTVLAFARNPFATPTDSHAGAQDTATAPQRLFQRTVKLFERVDSTGEGDLPYRLLRPDGTSSQSIRIASMRFPLIIFLHGAGERGADNERSLTHLVPFVARSDFPIGQVFVLVPQCPPDQRWVETDWSLREHRQPLRSSAALQAVMAIVDRLVSTESIDPGRIYIMGLSMGGFGVWDALARWPERFAAGIPICGGADLLTAARVRHIPIRVFPGERDTTVWPQRSRGMVGALRSLKAPVEYREYAKVGHAAWGPALQEPDLVSWLLAQRR